MIMSFNSMNVSNLFKIATNPHHLRHPKSARGLEKITLQQRIIGISLFALSGLATLGIMCAYYLITASKKISKNPRSTTADKIGRLLRSSDKQDLTAPSEMSDADRPPRALDHEQRIWIDPKRTSPPLPDKPKIVTNKTYRAYIHHYVSHHLQSHLTDAKDPSEATRKPMMEDLVIALKQQGYNVDEKLKKIQNTALHYYCYEAIRRRYQERDQALNVETAAVEQDTNKLNDILIQDLMAELPREFPSCTFDQQMVRELATVALQHFSNDLPLTTTEKTDQQHVLDPLRSEMQKSLFKQKELTDQTFKEAIQNHVAAFLRPYLSGDKTQEEAANRKPMMGELVIALKKLGYNIDDKFEEIQRLALEAYFYEAARGMYVQQKEADTALQQNRIDDYAFDVDVLKAQLEKDTGSIFNIMTEQLLIALPHDFPNLSINRDKVEDGAMTALVLVYKEKAKMAGDQVKIEKRKIEAKKRRKGIND